MTSPPANRAAAVGVAPAAILFLYRRIVYVCAPDKWCQRDAFA
jgi:hypothetical protein